MNKYFLIILCLFSSLLMFSQETDSLESETVPFAIIENPPVFPGCEKLDKKLQKMCLQNQIGKHVAKNFNTSLAHTLGLGSGRKKLYVMFLIASDGLVKDVKARGPHKIMEEEAIRVISELPKMSPGLQKGKPIGVKYTIPITFLVENKEGQKETKN